MDPALLSLIEAGVTIVTPNRRSARALKREFDACQRARERAVWPSADILPWSAWLERTWSDLCRLEPASRLLTATQELALWEQIVADSPHAHALLDAAAAARIAREAWALQCAWQLTPALRAQGGAMHADGRAYLEWLDRFLERLAGRGWLTAAELPDAIAVRVRSRGMSPVARLVLLGFDQLSPQQRALADALRAAGTPVEERQPPAVAGLATRRVFSTAADELRAVASEVRHLVARDPGLRVGVVVPDLSRVRGLVTRVFDDALEPDRCLPGPRTRPRPWNLSLGQPLSHEPLVHAALAILRLARGELPLAEMGALLRSPFLAGGDREFTARSRLDARLRRRGRMTVSVDALQRAASGGEGGGVPGCAVFASALQRWVPQARESTRTRLLPSAWSPVFLTLLATLGWPGDRPLDSEEFQTCAKWREVVSGLAVLDPIVGALRYDEALSWLARLAAETLFQPETPETPVQVLGVLEASGLAFDRLFVTGLHDEAWPPPARPNPLLPLSLQRAHGVPHATPEWETGFARRMVAAWCASAERVVFSHPVRDGDRRLRPSPLIAGIDAADEGLQPEPRGGTYAESILAAARIEYFEDDFAPALAQGHAAPGGAAVFRDQAACPFRAFALHRLGAQPLETGRQGLDARERGTVVHAAAARLWEEIGTSERLLAWSPAALHTALQAAAEAAVEDLARDRPDALGGVYRDLEVTRVRDLLARLVLVERQRAPFRVVEREAPRTVAIGGLVVQARVDRVDELEDGSRVLIDYKTGKSSAAAWWGERPDEPQLPLYAVTDPGEVAAVAFATLRADDVGFKGLARSEGLLPGVRTPADARKDAAFPRAWPDLLGGWRAAVEVLAAEFIAGHARVAPKRYPRTCEHCTLGPFCRVKERYDRGPVTVDSDEDTGDG
jgi:probable DNA repair protein